MPTVFERVNKYADQKKKKYLTTDQRCELGRLIISAYNLVKPKTTVVHKVVFKNELGSFRVIDYPHSFVPSIDKLVKEYYANLPAEIPRERKRIPSKFGPKPVFSSRNIK